jgi:IS30 family transposase
VKSYTHISSKERQKIEYFLTNGLSLRAIARRLSRSHKAISREVKRLKNYSWEAADHQYRAKRFGKRSKIAKNPWLQKHIAKCLADKQSPEQISGRLRYERNPSYVSFKTIYIYVNKEAELKKLLPEYVKRPFYKNFKIVNKRLEALPSVHGRVEGGELLSWEADLMRFGKSVENVTTLFNRPSKLVRLIKNKNGKLETVLGGIKKYKRDINMLTMDRGAEFLRVNWFYENGIMPYYCDAMSPGQKGGCENTNRRVRKWLPKKTTDISLVGQRELDRIARNMNNTPRKCLGFKTPLEAYYGT